MEKLLNDAELSDATLQFCDRIISNYSFYPVFEAALKRAVWHHCIPELARIESEALDENFRKGLVNYFRDPENSEKVLHVTNLSKIGKRVQEAVDLYLKDESKQ